VAEFNSAWGNGECFPGVENELRDAGDRAAVRIILNVRAAMALGTSDLAPAIKLGSAAMYFLRLGSYAEVNRG
jgi:hypothetical protein